MAGSKLRRVDTASSFIYYVDTSTSNVAHRHVAYERDGTLLRRSTHSVLLPPPTGQPTAPEDDWNDEPNMEALPFVSDSQNSLPDPGNFGDLDIAYIQEISELDLDMVKKRNRTAAVRPGGIVGDTVTHVYVLG